VSGLSSASHLYASLTLSRVYAIVLVACCSLFGHQQSHKSGVVAVAKVCRHKSNRPMKTTAAPW
jgi:hypothetical protein